MIYLNDILFSFRYLSVLVELARVEGGTIHGTLIAQQILDVAIRVDTIRQFATEQMVSIDYLFALPP